MKRLKKSFYLDSPQNVAKKLLGKNLCRKTDKGLMIGKIVETEAYLSENDPACHAYKKKTPRNFNMFEEGGISYVYIIYGFYYCFNVVTGKKDKGEAVLIRALEPISGIDIMKNYREVIKEKDLTNGPSKLCLAMNIDKSQNGLDLINDESLFIIENENIIENDIVTTTRIGLTQGVDLPLRYYIRNNIYVSKIIKGL
ncbi:MAG: DNA-3-methyladenine glycosylase [Candidatus Sericytochromatia bacterium]